MRAASASSPAERTMLMPLPPPPAAALISSGKPIASAAARKASMSPVGVADGATGHALRAREIARGNLVAHQSDRLGVGADEDEPGRLHRRREARVLGQKAVAWMDRVGARPSAPRR